MFDIDFTFQGHPTNGDTWNLIYVTHHHEMSRKSRWLITSKLPLKSKWIKNIDYFVIAETHP